MGRKIQHNNIVTDELLTQCNKENIELGNDFLDYLRSVDRSPNTINAYRRDLYIFWGLRIRMMWRLKSQTSLW